MLAKLEQFVHRLVEDEAFRANATRNPERAVALFGLTGPERKGALKLCLQMAGPKDVMRPNGWWL